MTGTYARFTTKYALTYNLQKSGQAIDEFYPKSFILNEEEPFRQHFRRILAESVLKKFDGELTLQTLLALNITESRLLSDEPLVDDAQNEVLKMSKQEVLDKAESLLDQHSWLSDLKAHYSDKVDMKSYIAETLDKLTEKFPQTRMNGDKNIWLFKPGQSFAGDEISLHTDEDSVFEASKAYH